MHHGHRHGRGSRRFGHFGRFDRETFLAKLEEYQKDLEQELADVHDLLRRLKESQPETTPTA
jgi:hypothetical protein